LRETWPCERGRRESMRRQDQAGMALLSVLVVIMVLALLGGLVLYLAGQESQLSTVRYRAAQSLNIAEGGAWAARAALMAVVNADPQDAATLDVNLAQDVERWYANGNPQAQDPLAFLSRVRVNGHSLGALAEGMHWVLFSVDWSMQSPLKLRFLAAGTGDGPPGDPMLQYGAQIPRNDLGEGHYQAVVILTRRREQHWSCAGGGECYVHRAYPANFAIPLHFEILSDGWVSPAFRRRVSLSGDFRVLVGRRTFADWAVFLHMIPLNEYQHGVASKRPFGPVDIIDGPVHSNGRLYFHGFPKFGTPDTATPCDQQRIRPTPITSTDIRAGFFRLRDHTDADGRYGHILEANEWVENGVRVAAPVLPDCTLSNPEDDADNPAAQFQRGFDADPSTPGIQPILLSQDTPNVPAIALGANPSDRSIPRLWEDWQAWRNWRNARLREVVPELRGWNGNEPPWGIYIPVVDANRNGRSDDGDQLAGGIYVRGDLKNLVMSNCPPQTPGWPYCGRSSSDKAYYYLERWDPAQGVVQTVLIEVDRANNRTTVTNSTWPEPRTRTFVGVPRGFQGVAEPPGTTVIYVEGKIGLPDQQGTGLKGTVEEREQVMIAAASKMFVSDHIRYERPPSAADPRPDNVLGLWTIEGKIWVPLLPGNQAPPDLDVHAFLMVGVPGGRIAENELDGALQCGRDYMPGDRGYLRVLGGLVSPWLPRVRCEWDPVVMGYRLWVTHDRRIGPGFAPPYFPVTSLPYAHIRAEGLAGSRPGWRERTPVDRERTAFAGE
jgi:type II secretory pathway pseudopilin PulG